MSSGKFFFLKDQKSLQIFFNCLLTMETGYIEDQGLMFND